MNSLPNSQRHTWYEKALNLVSIIKPGEGESCILLAFNACLLMCAHYLLKVIREPLILAYGGAEYKSYATAIQALILIFFLPVFSYIYHRYSSQENRSAIVNKVLTFFIFNLLIFIGLQYAGYNIGIAFYVWLGIFNVMVVAQFWAYAADLFNIKTGQRLFVVIAIGASLGAWIGSRIAGVIFPNTGVLGIMILVICLLACCIFLTRKIDSTIPSSAENKEQAHQDDSSHQWLDGLAVVFRNRYLMAIAFFVTLLVFVNSTGEYILARLVSEESNQLLADGVIVDKSVWQGEFYANYYSWITLISFIIQTFLVSRLFRWVGVSGSILILPLIIIINYGVMLFFPIFSVIRIVMTMENSVNYSIQNTTRHALFLPIPRKLKYLGKTAIETFFFRLGDLLYGAFIFYTATNSDFTIYNYIFINMLLGSVLFMIAWNVGRRNLSEVRSFKKSDKLELKAQLPQLVMHSGQTYKFSISECTFIDPSVGDALHYYSKKVDGDPLPEWIQFDQMTRTFTFKPPSDTKEDLDLKVIGMDFDGNVVRAFVRVSITDLPLPQLG